MRILACVFGLLISSMASAVSLNKVVVFGDSLSDTGNLYEYMQHQLPQSPPYYKGRFTNGPVWIETLMKEYYPQNAKEHLFNYAFGGAGVSDDLEDGPLFTLRKEVDSYMLAHQDRAEKDALFVVWIGSNNYLGVPDDAEQTVIDVTEGIRRQLQRLIEAGAQHFMIVNIPDLSITPFAREAEVGDIVKTFSEQHNDRLLTIKTDLERQNPAVQFAYLDVNVTIKNIFENPESYGFSNVTDTCYDAMIDEEDDNPVIRMVASVKASSKRDACEGHLFFDPVHPAVGAHRLMAEKAKELIEQSGIQFIG